MNASVSLLVADGRALSGMRRGKAAAEQLLRDLRRPVIEPDRLADVLRGLADDAPARQAFLTEVQRALRTALVGER